MTTTRPGRGSFAALYEASRQVATDATPRQLKLDQLEPNPDQPRQLFHRETLEELATSIKTYGLLQPLVVRPHPSGHRNQYQIIAGERRFQACKLLALESVPVIVKTMDDAEVRQVALIENLQRENITPLEEAQVLKEILDETGLSHRELGDRIGKTKAYVEQRVRLLRYPIEVQAALSTPEGTSAFSPGHAKAVVQLDDASERIGLIQLIETVGLSVREAERRVHQLKRLHESGLSPERIEKVAQDVLRPDGLGDAALETAIAGPARKPAKAALKSKTVDMQGLGIAQLVLAAQASGEWTLDVETLRATLKADLAALS